MGELIRNIKEIQLGNERLMVEENEGYSKGQGKLIHIQNKSFRYLMREKPFMQLLATILRARSEMEYYKSTHPRFEEAKKVSTLKESTEQSKKICLEICSRLEADRVQYRVVDDGEAFVTILICNADYTVFRKSLKKLGGMKRLPHVFGKERGYAFLYQMRPFELYRYKGMLVECYFQLPCMSLTPKTWIPLDRALQERSFSQRDRRGETDWLDHVSLYIYDLCWAVFQRGVFSDRDKAKLDSLEEALSDPAMKPILEKVFFGFTEQLLLLLEKKDYDGIIPAYYGFDGY
ncbi:MAG: hypothetical protein K5739_03500 [Lachnospiraceae bacterium]|nr:hypothetical protein [Lachnospiraceae bacterium]